MSVSNNSLAGLAPPSAENVALKFITPGFAPVNYRIVKQMIILNSCTIKNLIFLAGGVIITRIKKNPEIRREEFIDAAFELFCSAGYEKTLIIDIVKKVRVAKGTFYYYFPSKEAILFAIITRYISQMITTFKNEIYQLPALSKLQLFIKNFFLPHQVGMIFEKLKEDPQIITKTLFIATSALERILGIKEGLLELPILRNP